MQERYLPLSRLPVGNRAEVKEVSLYNNLRRRLLDLGLIPGTQVLAVQKSPSGDPIAYQIRGAVIAIRAEEASQILVEMA